MYNKNIKKKSIALATVALVAANSTCAFAAKTDTKVTKDETVYSILDENGNVTKNIVSDWIKSDSSLGNIKDVSKLTNIKNIKGNEKPSINGNNVTWDVNGDDLYYQGESKEQLPIDVNIRYELNGKVVNPKDVKGKSGDFKITIKLKNNVKKNVQINGEDRIIYTPFLTAGEILLDRDNFKDIEISAGTMLDEGNNASITFISLPGLSKSLNLSSDLNNYLNLKDEIVITGNTTNFKVPTIMFALTSDITGTLEDIDGDMNFSELKSALQQLEDAGTELVDGAKQVADGSETLNSSYSKFDDGVKSLDSGITTLKEGSDTLANSLPTLNEGAMSLTSGLQQINEGQQSLNSGIATYTNSANQLDGAYAQLTSGISSLDQGISSLSKGAETLANNLPTLDQGAMSLTSGLAQLNSSQSKFASGVQSYVSNANKLDQQYK